MKKKKKRGYPVRGTMDVTGALVRCALACSAFIALSLALSVSGAYRALGDGAALLAQAAMTVLCFGLPAAYGLFAADGDQSHRLPLRALSAAQLAGLLLTGVLLAAPMTLLHDLVCAPLARMGLSGAQGAGAPPFALFLPMLVKSALLAPLCEELFFRGYLHAALEAAQVRGASVIGALFFALVHGVDAALPGRFLLGLLLLGLMRRTGSLLAPAVVHAAYNFTILMLSFLGLSGLFSGLSFVSCLVRVPLCAAFVYALTQACTAVGSRERLRFGPALTMRQAVLLAVALYALIVGPMLMSF